MLNLICEGFFFSVFSFWKFLFLLLGDREELLGVDLYLILIDLWAEFYYINIIFITFLLSLIIIFDFFVAYNILLWQYKTFFLFCLDNALLSIVLINKLAT